MKINKSNKYFKILILVLVLFFALSFLVSCDNGGEEIIDDPIDVDKIEYCIDMINEIGSVTLKSKNDIDFAKELYDSLKEEEKALVVNYNVLQTAINTIEYLEHEDDYILEGYQELISHLDELIPEYVNKDILELDFINRYEYATEYNNYIFLLDWSTNNYKYIGQAGGVYHGASEEVVTVSCAITCLKTSKTAAFSKTVTIEHVERPNKDTPIVVSYFCGKYNGFNEVDYNTIDIVNYAFAQIAYNNQKGYYIEIGNGPDLLEMANDLHKYGIKLVLSLGGWHDDSSFWTTYSNASKTDSSRKQVALSCLDVMQKYNLDGIDMDWEYPSSKEKDNFTALMKEISVTLKEADNDYLITAAIPGNSSRFDYKKLNSYMDYLYIMTYDLDLDGTNITKHMCDVSSAKNSAQYLIRNGFDASKVVIGIAFYARLFTDVGPTNNGYRQSCSGRSAINYARVKEALGKVGSDVIKVYDNTAECYYLYNQVTREWISYDGEETITAKYNYAVSSKLGGVMYWSYQNDSTGDLMKFLDAARSNVIANK